MIDGLSVLAVIPARGGSKRLRGKNLTLINGKPLISYTLEAALSCKMLDRIAVSTDEEAIAESAVSYGVAVIARPAHLATDEARLGPVCTHALLEMERLDACRYDVHVLLQPTSPLRTAAHIISGLELLRSTKCDSVLGVRLCTEPPYWMKIIMDGLVQPFLPERIRSAGQRKQDLPSIYMPNGALYISYRDVLLASGEAIGTRVAPLVMKLEESVDIDTEYELLIAESLIRLSKRAHGES